MIRFVLLVLLFAAAVYLVVRFVDRRSGRVSWGPAVRRQQQQQRRSIAPDDDENFLRDLDRLRRHPQDPDADG